MKIIRRLETAGLSLASGCSGFQYGFTFDEKINDGDLTIEKNGVSLVD